MADKKNDKSEHPKGSKENPIDKGPNSQAGLQAHKGRQGYQGRRPALGPL